MQNTGMLALVLQRQAPTSQNYRTAVDASCAQFVTGFCCNPDVLFSGADLSCQSCSSTATQPSKAQNLPATQTRRGNAGRRQHFFKRCCMQHQAQCAGQQCRQGQRLAWWPSVDKLNATPSGLGGHVVKPMKVRLLFCKMLSAESYRKDKTT